MGQRVDSLGPIKEKVEELDLNLVILDTNEREFNKRRNREAYHGYIDAKADVKTTWKELKKLMRHANQRRHI